MNVTQRLANPNWRPSAICAHAMVKAMRALTGLGRDDRATGADDDASRAVTQPLPTL